ncbi:MAG: phage infection protein [Bacteroidia bacterium]
MNKLKLTLENCYGINKLDSNFDFSKGRSFVVYAPNGVMKTSLANTFNDISNGENPKERLHGNSPICTATIDNNPINPAEIFVIKSYQDKYSPDESISTLLVDEVSKTEYDKIYSDILKKKNALIVKLNKTSGVKKDDLESLILADFKEKDFFKLLNDIDLTTLDENFSNISYATIFEKDVIEFLKKPEVVGNINAYIEKYNALIDKSKYFKKGVFNPTKADNVAKALTTESFFKAEHTIKFSGDSDSITSDEDLKAKLLAEKKEILENKELKKVEDEIKKVSVIKLREILEKHPILPELKNLNNFKLKLWKSYLKNEELSIKELIETYANGKEKLDEIEVKAQSQRTLWDDVVGKFKSRFFVPFEIEISNKSNAILGKTSPNILFKFINAKTGVPKEMKRQELDGIEILSQGEKRALYILNIMFNVEAKIKENAKTLFIIDDIADSFDYRNKYAIIQYLKDISKQDFFYQIILTHNFDFFRTLESRKIATYNNCLFSYKTDTEIKLLKAEGIKNPFINDWKNDLSNPKKLIASISFVRNIIEYVDGEANPDYLKLTSVLHWKADTENIFVSDLQSIFTTAIRNITFPSMTLTDKVVDLIFNEADKCLIAPDGINLENKIVLSIAIRLRAEAFMISKIADKRPIDGSQTGKLFGRFKKEFKGVRDTEITLLDEVCLITPDNIHVNSFMYEPILDMSDLHLRELYKKVKVL